MPPATRPNPGPYDLGPFQEIVGIQWGVGVGATYTGRVVGIEDTPNRSWFYFNPCQTAETTAGNLGYARIQFSMDENVPIADVLQRGTWVGDSSGATWTPQNQAFICLESNTGNEDFWGDNFIVLGSGRVYENFVQANHAGRDDGMADSFGLYINYGEFPGATVPPFTFFETITVTVTP